MIYYLKLNLVEDDLCSFCYKHTETLIHFFCDCLFSKNIWSELEKWILAKTGYDIVFTKNNIIVPLPTGTFFSPSWGYDDIYMFGIGLIHLTNKH